MKSYKTLVPVVVILSTILIAGCGPNLDSKQIAYVDATPGEFATLRLCNFDGSDDIEVIESGPVRALEWDNDGKRLFYLTSDCGSGLMVMRMIDLTKGLEIQEVLRLPYDHKDRFSRNFDWIRECSKGDNAIGFGSKGKMTLDFGEDVTILFDPDNGNTTDYDVYYRSFMADRLRDDFEEIALPIKEATYQGMPMWTRVEGGKLFRLADMIESDEDGGTMLKPHVQAVAGRPGSAWDPDL